MSDPKPTEKMDFDDMLGHVGGWGKFQYRLLLISVPFTFFLAYVGYAPILFLYVPDHWCAIPENYKIALNTTDEEALINVLIPIDKDTQKRDQCHIYDLNQIRNVNNTSEWPIIQCPEGWQYNFTGYFTSASTEFDWVCNDAWKPAFTQSIFYVGAICGTLIFGWVSDHFGRYTSFISSNSIVLISGIATPFAFDFASFLIVRFVMGLSFMTFFLSLLMLTLEYVSLEKRAVIGNLSLAIAMSFGGAYQPWILKVVQDWKILHHILFGQTIIIFIAPWFIKESSRWLIQKGRIDEAIDILKDIAEENGQNVSPLIYEAFRKSAILEYEKTKELNLTFLDLFRTPNIRRNVLLMICNWSLTSVLFDGHIRNIENLQYSIYWTFTISSALEFPSDLLSIWGLEYIGRRWSAVISLAGSAITMVICAFVIENALFVTIMAMTGRFFITYAMNTAAQISLEVVPTQLRGQGTALGNVCAVSANFFAPQIVYSKVLDDRAPFFILGFGSLLAAFLALFLPETAGIKLPDTIQEAEESLKPGQGIWNIPKAIGFMSGTNLSDKIQDIEADTENKISK